MQKILIGLIAIVAASVVSCSKTTESGSTASVTALSGTITQNYGGAGSFWNIKFTATNFRIDKYTNYGDTTSVLAVYGTYATNATTKIVTLTVTSAGGSGAPSPGDKAYGIEIPGSVFFLKPDGNSEIIPMISAGTCPIVTKSYNWIKAKFTSNTLTPGTEEGYGQATFTNNGSGTVTACDITNKKNMDGSAGGANGTGPTGACSSGYLSGGGVNMYLTSAGGAIVHATNDFIFASPKHTGDVVAGDVTGTYTGLVFSESSTGDKDFPAKMILDGSANGTGDKITDPDTDATQGSPVTFNNFAAEAGSNGIFKLDMVGGGRLNCNYYVDATAVKKVIACNGYDASNKTFFFLMRQR